MSEQNKYYLSATFVLFSVLWIIGLFSVLGSIVSPLLYLLWIGAVFSNMVSAYLNFKVAFLT